MQVFVDDKPVNASLLGAGTLEEGLRGIQATISPRRILVGFRCDGEDIAGPAMAETLQRPVASFERLELFSSTKEDLVVDTMEQASTSLEEAETTTQNVAELLIQGKSSEAIRTLGDCLRVWQQVHDAVGKSLMLLEMDPEETTVRDQPLSTAIARPKDVLLQIKQALTAQDYVLLADVLQYELADVTNLWHLLIARIRQEAEDQRDTTG
jgi:hypothetical protein